MCRNGVGFKNAKNGNFVVNPVFRDHGIFVRKECLPFLVTEASTDKHQKSYVPGQGVQANNFEWRIQGRVPPYSADNDEGILAIQVDYEVIANSA